MVLIPVYLMRLVFDKHLTPHDASLLLKSTITTGSQTCCKGILIFICVVGLLPSAESKPAYTWDVASLPVSVDYLLQKIMRKKVDEKDVEGMILLLTTLDSMIAQLLNAVTIFIELHLAWDTAKEAKLATSEEPKRLESLFKNSRCSKILNIHKKLVFLYCGSSL